MPCCGICIGRNVWIERLSESSPTQMQDKYASTSPLWLSQKL